ncbi:hypothetical protein [Iodidimonas sp. SYSU 1G8]
MTPDRLRLVLLIVAAAVIAFNVYMYLTWPEAPIETVPPAAG